MFRWRLAIGAVLIAGGYAALLIITLVAATELSPGVKTALTAFFGCNAAADQAHSNCATGSTNNQLPEETLFQAVPQRFGRWTVAQVAPRFSA
jgi:hypothetical protein